MDLREIRPHRLPDTLSPSGPVDPMVRRQRASCSHAWSVVTCLVLPLQVVALQASFCLVAGLVEERHESLEVPRVELVLVKYLVVDPDLLLLPLALVVH